MNGPYFEKGVFSVIYGGEVIANGLYYLPTELKGHRAGFYVLDTLAKLTENRLMPEYIKPVYTPIEHKPDLVLPNGFEGIFLHSRDPVTFSSDSLLRWAGHEMAKRQDYWAVLRSEQGRLVYVAEKLITPQNIYLLPLNPASRKMLEKLIPVLDQQMQGH